MASESDLDDPASWTVDHVIETLCHRQIANWAGSGLNVPIPRPEEVEHAFKANDIDGDVLLRLETSDLEQMNLRSIGQLSKLRRIIKFLRNSSAIYISENGRDESASISHTIERSTPLHPDNTRIPSEKIDDRSRSRGRPSFAASHNSCSNEGAGPDPTHEATLRLSSTAKREYRPDQTDAVPKQDLDMLDIVTENVEAQQVRNENSGVVKRIAPTFVSLARNKRYSDGLESDISKKARHSLDSGDKHNIGGHVAGRHLGYTSPAIRAGAVTEADFSADTDEGAESASELNHSSSLSQYIDLGPYQQLLDRYPVEDGDEVLPAYGESDDGEFEVTDDSDSMHSDAASVEMASNLPAQQVDSIIDATIETFQKRWQSRKLPMAHKRAYEQWYGTANDKDHRRFLILKTKDSLNHMLARLTQLRDAVHQSSWTNPEDTRKQCECLEATVSQQQEYLYSISVLETDTAPDRPDTTPLTHSRTPKVKTVEGDIVCESDSNDGLDDFVSKDSMEYHEAVAVGDNDDIDDEEGDHQQPASGSALFNTIPDSSAWPQTVIGDHMQENELAISAKGIHIPDRPTQNQTVDQMPGDQPRTPSRYRVTDADAGYADDEDGEMPVSSSRKKTSAKSRAASVGRNRNPLPMPSSPSSDPGQSSDLDQSPRIPQSRLRNLGKSSIQPIVLTSSPAQTSGGIGDSDMDLDGVRTPELNPGAFDDADAKDSKALLPFPSSSRKLGDFAMPSLHDARNIPWSMLNKEPDEHGLALAKVLVEMSDSLVQRLLNYVIPLTITDVEETVQSGISALLSDGDVKIEVPAAKQELAMLLTMMFMSYAKVDNLVKEDPSDEDCDTAWNLLYVHGHFFHRILLDLLRKLNNEPRKLVHMARTTSADDTAAEDSSFENVTEFESDAPGNVRKGQKPGKSASGSKADKSSASTAHDSQRLAKRRVEHQQSRKALINQKLARHAERTGDVISVPVNFKEPLVFLDPHIARMIKPHQKKGLEFIWRELIEDPQHQGCLLAHTMGLGKTMQVIAVLVTIAQCLKSNDQRIRDYIPPHMRSLRILILSPPALCENWFDELMFWMPEHDTLGPICKITSRTKQPYYDIKQWSEAPGVLLLGYDRLVSYTKMPHRGATDSDEQYASRLAQTTEMSGWLLDTPCIVVADEAHMLKNPTTKRAEVAMRIRTTSRIALTGSPLSNHLEEYWAMINFIAPGYLDDIGKFRNKFVEPINRCLSIESTGYDQRLGLKKMHVLKTILEPKVNRADITAIQSDMPAKTEFFITVPLSDTQFRMYKLCADYFRGLSSETTGRAKTASLWQWISVLSLLCNHPWTFDRKLKDPKRRNKARVSMRAGSDDYEDEEGGTQAQLGDEVDTSDQPAMLQAMRTALDSGFETSPPDPSLLSSPAISYRMLLVHAIVKESLTLGEKLLIFSHSLLTLDYMELVLDDLNCPFERIDGGVATDRRQRASKEFNSGLSKAQAFLISTRAGGLGLNLFGATRVIILDYSFNPSWEEQAIGRAYRLGQKEPVFVYRFRSGGTFEDWTFNQMIFKTQLFTRIIDHKAVLRKSSKLDAARYLKDPQMPKTEDFDESKGKDPKIMDKLIAKFDCIRNIVLTETYAQDIQESLTPNEIAEADKEVEDERLARSDPAAYQRRLAVREAQKSLQQDRFRTRTSFKQGELSAPAQMFIGLMNHPIPGPLVAQMQPYQLPVNLQQATQGTGQSYDDTTMPERTRPGNTDGTGEAPQTVEDRLQERQQVEDVSSKRCNPQ